MSKTIKTIFIILGIIFLIGIFANYFGRRYLGKLEEIIPPEQFSQLQGLSPEKILKPQEKEYKEFISPDGKLKISYFSDWMEIKNEEVLKKITPEEWKEKYNLENLFLAQKFTLEGKFAQLIVNKGIFGVQKRFEEISEEMKKSNLQRGWKMEVIKSEIEEKEIIFEAKYQKEDRYDVYSKEKIIFGDQKDYLITFITFDKDWRDFEKEADFIIGSAQLSD